MGKEGLVLSPAVCAFPHVIPFTHSVCLAGLGSVCLQAHQLPFLGLLAHRGDRTGGARSCQSGLSSLPISQEGGLCHALESRPDLAGGRTVSVTFSIITEGEVWIGAGGDLAQGRLALGPVLWLHVCTNASIDPNHMCED